MAADDDWIKEYADPAPTKTEQKPKVVNNATSKALSEDTGWLSAHATPVDAEYDISEYAPPANETHAQRLKREALAANPSPGRAQVGLAEAGLSTLTGAASSATGGLAGMGRTAYGLAKGEGLDEAVSRGAGVSQKVQRAGTYQPRTSSGKLINDLVATPMELAGEYGGKVGGAVGALPGAIAGDEAMAKRGEAIGESVGEALPAAGATLRGGVQAFKQARAPMTTLPPKNKMEAAAMEAQDLGMALPPSQANPSLINRFVTGYGGKIQTDQAASIKNQPRENGIIKKGLGMDPETDISYDSLAAIRKEDGGAYQAIKNTKEPIYSNGAYEERINNLTKDWQAAERDFPEIAQGKTSIVELQKMMLKKEVSPTGAIEMVKELRSSAKTNLKSWDDPAKQALGKAQRQAADALDKLVEDNLKENTLVIQENPDLVANYRAARKRIAMTYDIEAALNDTTGNVDMAKLAKLLKDQKLSGYLKDVAEFAKAFPKNAQLPERIGTHPGISPLDVATAGIETAAAPTPARAAGVVGAVLGRPIARSIGLSDWYQRGPGNARRPDMTNRKAARKALAAGYAGEEAAQEAVDEEYR